MRAIVIMLVGGIFFLAGLSGKADPAVASVQQTLKEQGFYYGKISGTKDAETTAAIRRFQIRNGLQINGELNAETQKSLGLKPGTVSPRSAPAPPVPVTPRGPQPPTTSPDTSDLRDDGPIPEDDGYFRGNPPPPSPRAGEGRLFEGTPYDGADPAVQQQVIAEAQSRLARRGLYRSGVDGVYGPGTAFALRAFQARFGLVQSGVLDVETLATLRLLPEQTGGDRRGPPRGRVYRRYPPRFSPGGERIYIPR